MSSAYLQIKSALSGLNISDSAVLDRFVYRIYAKPGLTPTTTVIALYCWKAKAENIIKIKKGYPEETKDISVDLNNINI